MPLGHVAVVTRIIDKREIGVDHANWIPGEVGREVRIFDVSADNNWSAVRVELSKRDHFGAVYAANGFIYPWPIELGPQIISVSEYFRAIREDKVQPAAQSLPIVIGPRGVLADEAH